TLITRPRRFGKTLTMSMLEWFFSIEKEAQSRHLFDGLAVEQAGAEYMAHRGQYPVIFLSLKDIKNPAWPSWERMLSFLRLFLAKFYNKYRYIRKEADNNDIQAVVFDHIVQGKATEDELVLSLSNLMDMMQQYYGKKVILLIDEYDAPIQQAWESGYYTGCIGFMRQFLSSALKTNDTLDFAVLTGVTRISKESIFSGLNNLDVCTVMSETYSDVMGFTPREVEKMAAAMDAEDCLPAIREWYDGYHFGRCEIYNPWSVVHYFRDRKVGDYWVNTSDNAILRLLLANADAQRAKTLQGLLSGEAVRVSLDEQVVYHELKQDKSALYTMLLTTGYLTAVAQERRNRYVLQIPNREVKDAYCREILNHLAPSVNQDTFDDLFDALFSGASEDFSRELQHIIAQVVSVYDAANKESFYHGFMLGLTALFLDSSYTVESNRESGYGRFDLAIFPKEVDKAGVIMEFKVAADENEMEEKAKEALQQIEDREYITEFQKRGVKEVWKYGIAFCGKKMCVKSSEGQ
ncbi:AAA family ATPase, partial [Dialister succinatiphilus]|uniref:AAA family ATPase n=1 Tax=Dialister succinatiphilus TaxID=487173 RepID=UPI00307A2B8A